MSLKFLIIPLFLFHLTCNAGEPVKAILTDIEGTTTSISFVHDVLFPYAKKHLPEYVLSHQQDPAVQKVIEETKEIALSPKSDVKEVIDTLITWIEQDKKITPLKTLQGMMWQDGYEQVAYQAHVYEDVAESCRKWTEEGLVLYIYSSGSVLAQKLLFSHTVDGDLTPFFSGYFDTKVGGKRESASYLKIADEMELAPESILFLSDTVQELDAAREAGMQTLMLVREGTTKPDDCPHESVTSFSEILFQ